MKLKRKLLQTGFFSIAMILAACGGGSQQEGNTPTLMPAEHGSMSKTQGHESSTDSMHKQHNSLADNFLHKDIVILEQPYQPSEATKTEMEQVIDAYLQVKDALVDGDVVVTDKATGLMLSKIEEVKPDKLDGEGFDAWQDHTSLYKDKLQEMRHIKGLEDKRSYFSHISEIMYCTIKSFGLKQGNLFAIFCPMALDNKGAYWISDRKTIQNPYMGAKMPTCGEIKEEL